MADRHPAGLHVLADGRLARAVDEAVDNARVALILLDQAQHGDDGHVEPHGSREPFGCEVALPEHAGDVSVSAVAAEPDRSVLDDDLLAGVLGVDDEHAGRPDGDMVDVRATATHRDVLQNEPAAPFEPGESFGDAPFASSAFSPRAVRGADPGEPVQRSQDDRCALGEFSGLRGGTCAGRIVGQVSGHRVPPECGRHGRCVGAPASRSVPCCGMQHYHCGGRTLRHRSL